MPRPFLRQLAERRFRLFMAVGVGEDEGVGNECEQTGRGVKALAMRTPVWARRSMLGERTSLLP